MNISEMRKIAERASEGDWIFDRVGFDSGNFAYEINEENRLIQLNELDYTVKMKAKFDADFIHEFRPSTALKLLDRVEKLEHLLAKISDHAGKTDGWIVGVWAREALSTTAEGTGEV